MKKYKFGFDIWGLTLFLLIMFPNLFWFVFPAPNDILRRESITQLADIIAEVFQVIMIVMLCFIKNRDAKSFSVKSKLILGAFGCCLCYFTAWILYYQGIVHMLIILSLCIFPCTAFLLYEIDRKNYITIIPTTIFSICHLIYGIVNFCNMNL